ncbi:XdhC family protein [Paenibacillus rigui]|uniref:Xanthine dehydrogenase n=1 Tax=Paenibacillus rigui TaxID=554312 RepID=A0A229UWH1_9BACL|nr:XdhC family protein [Paenibacillus rigui]OXM87774.1 xanthine dehydrogenase [Paenibacillus rigui]
MELHDIVTAIVKKQRAAVLATIVEVEGHAYRKQGVSMVLWDDGTSLGHLSPGCLEADLAEHALQLLEAGCAKIVDYDMRPTEDLSWGEAVGCGGLLRILLEPVKGPLKACLLELKRCLDAGLGIRIERVMTEELHDAVAAYRLLLAQTDKVVGSWRANGNSISAEEWACAITPAAGLRLWSCRYEAKPRLVIFGAGTDAVPVANGALRAGFSVTVADWRHAVCSTDDYADRVTRIIGFPEELVSRLALGANDYVIIMSHQLQRDKQFLDLAWDIPLAYLGILGSVSRTAQLLNGRQPPVWLHAPVGLDIGAQGAEEIAVSIVAELIQIRRHAAVRQTDSILKGVYGNDRHSRYLFGRRTKPSYGVR